MFKNKKIKSIMFSLSGRTFTVKTDKSIKRVKYNKFEDMCHVVGVY